MLTRAHRTRWGSVPPASLARRRWQGPGALQGEPRGGSPRERGGRREGPGLSESLEREGWKGPARRKRRKQQRPARRRPVAPAVGEGQSERERERAAARGGGDAERGAEHGELGGGGGLGAREADSSVRSTVAAGERGEVQRGALRHELPRGAARWR